MDQGVGIAMAHKAHNTLEEALAHFNSLTEEERHALFERADDEASKDAWESKHLARKLVSMDVVEALQRRVAELEAQRNNLLARHEYTRLFDENDDDGWPEGTSNVELTVEVGDDEPAPAPAHPDVADQQVFLLSPEEFTAFEAMLDQPARDLPNLRKLMQSPPMFRSVAEAEVAVMLEQMKFGSGSGNDDRGDSNDSKQLDESNSVPSIAAEPAPAPPVELDREVDGRFIADVGGCLAYGNTAEEAVDAVVEAMRELGAMSDDEFAATIAHVRKAGQRDD